MQITQNTLNYTNSYYQQEKKPFFDEELESSENIDGVKKDENKEDSKKVEDTKKNSSKTELSQDERQVVYELQARDTEVRAHEAAHQAAGGGMTGGASYSYQRGPDGRMYAIGGEVSISMPSGSTPEEVISNSQQVITAALAPANPSGQDMAVASGARSLMVQAQQAKAKEAYEENNQEVSKNDNKTDYGKEDDKSSSKAIDLSA